MSTPEIKCKKYEVGDVWVCKNNLEWEVLKATDDGKEALVLCLAYNICRWVDESGKHCVVGWPELINSKYKDITIPHVRIEDTKVEPVDFENLPCIPPKQKTLAEDCVIKPKTLRS